MTQMRTSTTTLGCPEWDLETIITNLSAYGYDAVDFRGLGEHLDLTVAPAFTSGIGETRRMLSDAGLAVSCVSSSIRLCEAGKRDDNLEEARRTIDVAKALDVPCVRVFGGGDVENCSREKLARLAADTVAGITELDGAEGIQWGVETHDHWVSGKHVRVLLDALPQENVGVIWDVGHTTRIGTEQPAASWAVYGARVVNTHFKDAAHDPYMPLHMGDGWRYVPLGEGDLPLAEAVRVLHENGYTGYLTLEHEKRWHPELPEPEAAFPHSVRWFKERLKALA